MDSFPKNFHQASSPRVVTNRREFFHTAGGGPGPAFHVATEKQAGIFGPQDARGWDGISENELGKAASGRHLPFGVIQPVKLFFLHLGWNLLPWYISIILNNPIIVQRAWEVVLDPHKGHKKDFVIRTKAVVMVEHCDPVADIAMSFLPTKNWDEEASFAKEGLGLFMEFDGKQVGLVVEVVEGPETFLPHL